MEYHQFEHMSQSIGLGISPAELQGHLLGAFVSDADFSFTTYLRQIQQFADLELDILTTDIVQPLATLCAQTVKELDDNQDKLSLFLPDDDASITSRLQALSEWVNGFLVGIGLSGIKDEQIPEDLKESLLDLREISQVEVQLDESEQHEHELYGLVEHVRVVVFLWHLRKVRLNNAQNVGEGVQSIDE